MEQIISQIKGLKNTFEETFNSAQSQIQQLRDDLDQLRRRSINRIAVARRNGEVSEDCARALGAYAAAAGIGQGKLNHLGHNQRDNISGLARDILGDADFKAALTTTDIPLPQAWSNELVELVSQLGTARRYGTVYPLGAGTVKLPRLKTDPAFGLVAMSGTVAEKSPQIEFATLSASKWGGLVRVPSEIDADSIVAIGQFIARYAARQMARIEDVVFWIADGTSTYDSISGLTKAVVTNSKVQTLPSTKTKISDADLASLRAMRSIVDDAVLFNAAYYFHPTLEQALAAFNNSTNGQVFVRGADGAYTLDGFQVRWINVLPPYSTSANPSIVFGLFGDVSYGYLAVRGGMALDTSRDAGFATDEILIRAIERFTFALMAAGAVAGIRTAAS